MIRAAFQIFLFIFPWPLRRRLLSLFLGYKLHPSCKIGLSIILADELLMEAGARLGHFNYIGTLDTVKMDIKADIGNFNWITGLSRRLNSPFFRKKANRRSNLLMGQCSMIGHQHYIDCIDRIELAQFSAIAGTRSQLITHGVEPITLRQTCNPITIGEYTMVGTGSTITKGVNIPDRCIVSAGSVVSHINATPYSLIAGNPAVVIRSIPQTAKLFSRTEATIY